MRNIISNIQPTFYDRDYFETAKKRKAPSYSKKIFQPRMDNLANFIVNKFHPKTILDIGCAKGFLVESFTNLGIDAHGIDISEYAINSADSKIRNNLKLADIENEGLPYKEEYFDVIIALDFFEHIAKPEKVLAEINRTLKKRSCAFLTICSPNDPNSKKDPSHINIQYANYWIKLFNKYGFSWRFVGKKEISYEPSLDNKLKYLVKTLDQKLRYASNNKFLDKEIDYNFIIRK